MPASIACPFCSGDTEPANNRHDTRPVLGVTRTVAATRHWRECRNLACRATGPRMATPEAANLAFLAGKAEKLKG